MANIKIFKMDDCSWYAAHNLMEFLNWYNKHIDSIEVPDDLQELEIIEPEDGTMWSNENITQEDVETLGDADEICRGGIGDLKRHDGDIFKMQTFADVLGDEDIKMVRGQECQRKKEKLSKGSIIRCTRRIFLRSGFIEKTMCS